MIRVGSLDGKTILKMAAQAEKGSEHPLGVAVYEKGKQQYGQLK